MDVEAQMQGLRVRVRYYDGRDYTYTEWIEAGLSDELVHHVLGFVEPIVGGPIRRVFGRPSIRLDLLISVGPPSQKL